MAKMTTDLAAQRGIELLNELLAMKSMQDGVPRSQIGVIGPKEGNDVFAQDVQEVAMLIFTAQQAVPLMGRLAAAGRQMQEQGLIEVDCGDSFAEKALIHLLTKATAD